MFCRTLTVLGLCLLSACATTPGSTPTPLTEPDSVLMRECESLPLLPEQKPLLLVDDAVDDAAVSALYYECAKRQRALVQWVRGAVAKLRELAARQAAAR